MCCPSYPTVCGYRTVSSVSCCDAVCGPGILKVRYSSDVTSVSVVITNLARPSLILIDNFYYNFVFRYKG